MTTKFDYDVALSFAGEDRSKVTPIAKLLRKARVVVFFDAFERSKLWGRNLYDYLAEVYGERARFCVVFISKHYAKKAWTNHERRAAQARAFQENREYILPVRLDSTKIPGILPTIGYVDYRAETAESIVALVRTKLILLRVKKRGVHRHHSQSAARRRRHPRAPKQKKNGCSPSFEAQLDSISPQASATASERLRDDIESLRNNYLPHHSTFVAMQRGGSRSPLEMIKDVPSENDLLPLMAAIPEINSLEDQVHYLHRKHFAKLYRNSWVDRETQLVGAKMVELVLPEAGQPLSFLDAGCGNCAQYIALRTLLPENSGIHVKLYGLDYNPDWRLSVEAVGGEFVRMALPNVPEIKVDWVACGHVLQDQVAHPSVLFATVLGFSTVLNVGGICYITVPVKDAYPGLLDAVELCALSAKLQTIKAGRFRLKHSLFTDSRDPRNLTSFDYLVLRKAADVDPQLLRPAMGLGFLHLREEKTARTFQVFEEQDVPAYIRSIVANVKDTLVERNDDLRAFKLLSIRLLEILGALDCRPIVIAEERLRACIDNLHSAYMVQDRSRDEFRNACGDYLACLTMWLFSAHPPMSHENLVLRIHPAVENGLKHPGSIRVRIGNLNVEQVVRLLRHLVNLCRSSGVRLWDLFARAESYVRQLT